MRRIGLVTRQTFLECWIGDTIDRCAIVIDVELVNRNARNLDVGAARGIPVAKATRESEWCRIQESFDKRWSSSRPQYAKIVQDSFRFKECRGSQKATF